MNNQNLLTTKQAADYLGVNQFTLASWRRTTDKPNRGPAYNRIMGKVYYSQKDLDEWLQAGRVESSAIPENTQTNQ